MLRLRNVALLLNHSGALASVALSLLKKQPYSQKLLMVVPVTFYCFHFIPGK